VERPLNRFPELEGLDGPLSRFLEGKAHARWETGSAKLDRRGHPPIVTSLDAALDGGASLEMLFKIKEIGDDGLSLNLPITAAWLAAECPGLDAVPGVGGITVRGQLLPIGEGEEVFLRGTLRGVLESTCSRCLENARVPIDIPLAVTFVARPDGDDQSDDDDEESEKDADIATFDGVEVDLGPEIRDQILLTFPIKPLCREDCAGLCPVCGGNRNQTACACQVPQNTTRTPLAAALGKLKI
jgi:uncharacterized protein